MNNALKQELLDWIDTQSRPASTHSIYDRETEDWIDATIFKFRIVEAIKSIFGITLSAYQIDKIELWIYHQTYTACSHIVQDCENGHIEWLSTAEMKAYLPAAICEIVLAHK